MLAKVCPRCGTQYENLRSTTCPQCFAMLVTVDEATAEELAAARREVEQTPEFQQVKAKDDEHFQEQSFGACLGVIVITIATLILTVVLIAAAVHRRPPTPINGGAGRAGIPSPASPSLGAGRSDPLTTLPVSASELNDVMPANLPLAAQFRTFGALQRIESDEDLILPGTLTRIYHAVYQASDHQALDAYAIPAGQPTAEQNQFRLGITLAAQMQKRRAAPIFFATEYWHYAAVGSADPESPTADASFEDALGDYFRAKER